MDGNRDLCSFLQRSCNYQGNDWMEWWVMTLAAKPLSKRNRPNYPPVSIPAHLCMSAACPLSMPRGIIRETCRSQHGRYVTKPGFTRLRFQSSLAAEILKQSDCETNASPSQMTAILVGTCASQEALSTAGRRWDQPKCIEACLHTLRTPASIDYLNWFPSY